MNSQEPSDCLRATSTLWPSISIGPSGPVLFEDRWRWLPDRVLSHVQLSSPGKIMFTGNDAGVDYVLQETRGDTIPGGVAKFLQVPAKMPMTDQIQIRPFWLKLLPEFLRAKIEQHPNLAKILSNTGWLFSDRVLHMGVGLFVGLWVARYLGPAQFGLLRHIRVLVRPTGARL